MAAGLAPGGGTGALTQTSRLGASAAGATRLSDGSASGRAVDNGCVRREWNVRRDIAIDRNIGRGIDDWSAVQMNSTTRRDPAVNASHAAGAQCRATRANRATGPGRATCNRSSTRAARGYRCSARSRGAARTRVSRATHAGRTAAHTRGSAQAGDAAESGGRTAASERRATRSTRARILRPIHRTVVG
jgi:hypothetical protein